MLGQLALVCALTLATGWVVGVAKLSQVLMTSSGGRFPIASERRAEAFLLTFGLSKAVGNLLVGAAADTVGRRPCMFVGWLIGALFVVAVLVAPSWGTVVAADLLLGLNQALCWSTALFVSMDLLGPTRRACAVGLVETLGYTTIALASPIVAAAGHGAIDGLHAWLLALCLVCAVLSGVALRETRGLAISEGAPSAAPRSAAPPASDVGVAGTAGTGSSRGGSAQCSVQCSAQCSGKRADSVSRARPRALVRWPSGREDEHSVVRLTFAHVSCLDAPLVACCLVGFALNIASAFAWGAFSRWLARVGAEPEGGAAGVAVGTALLCYSLPKGVLQLPAGVLADRRVCRCGPREFVLLGLALVALALAGLAALAFATPSGGHVVTLAAPLAALLGAGTAIAYSPVIACVAARSDPSWRAAAMGTYRFWRDLGFAAGGLLLGGVADAAGGAPWAPPLLASCAVAATALVFARAYPCDVGVTTQPCLPAVGAGADRGTQMAHCDGAGAGVGARSAGGAAGSAVHSTYATLDEQPCP